MVGHVCKIEDSQVAKDLDQNILSRERHIFWQMHPGLALGRESVAKRNGRGCYQFELIPTSTATALQTVKSTLFASFSDETKITQNFLLVKKKLIRKVIHCLT